MTIVCMYSCGCIYIYSHVTHAHTCDMTQGKKNHNAASTQKYYIGQRKCEWCLKFQVSFCQKATNYRALLRKITYKDQP